MDYQKVGTIFNYIGGKTWLRDELRNAVNQVVKKNKITSYVEPFAGGLGAFLGIYDVLLENNIKNVILNDINKKIIHFYGIVNQNKECLLEEYMKIENEYVKTIPQKAFALKKTKDKEDLKKLLKNSEIYFKTIRDKFNGSENTIISAAYFLFLQNHCFNGVYRESSKGDYNTPFNWDTKIYEEQKIDQKLSLVKEVFSHFNIQFSSGSFESLKVNKSTLLYLDPPYINEDLIENQYNKSGFGLDKQKKLIDFIKDKKFIYSNHDHPILTEEFNKLNRKILINKISRKNIISASNESRKKDKIEILVVGL